jgi:hypothetical protein
MTDKPLFWRMKQPNTWRAMPAHARTPDVARCLRRIVRRQAARIMVGRRHLWAAR